MNTYRERLDLFAAAALTGAIANPNCGWRRDEIAVWCADMAAQLAYEMQQRQAVADCDDPDQKSR